MKHLKKVVIMIFCLALSLPYNMSYAHSGRTDSSGGHHDYKNVSGLGDYHYHCGGYPPHLHKNGVCPYSSSANTASLSPVKKVSKYYKSSTVKKVQKKLNKLGYKCGTADGIYGTKTKNAIKDFQQDEGMTINGEIKKALLKKLKINI
ncbi:MAG: peptidoglycan-binding protein [Lachnospiraceae bacterium]|nr:peptidoglycan-binding protein [Lachnospiraceae bacterium]